MELYKFISENELKKYKGGFVVVDNRIYTNPSEEMIRQAGYKNLVQTEKPEFDIEKEYLETFYVDGDVIKTAYKVKPIEVEEIEV